MLLGQRLTLQIEREHRLGVQHRIALETDPVDLILGGQIDVGGVDLIGMVALHEVAEHHPAPGHHVRPALDALVLDRHLGLGQGPQVVEAVGAEQGVVGADDPELPGVEIERVVEAVTAVDPQHRRLLVVERRRHRPLPEQAAPERLVGLVPPAEHVGDAAVFGPTLEPAPTDRRSGGGHTTGEERPSRHRPVLGLAQRAVSPVGGLPMLVAGVLGAAHASTSSRSSLAGLIAGLVVVSAGTVNTS